MTDCIAGNADDAEWDTFVGSHPDGHHEQTSRYARNRADYGFGSDRIVIREGSTIIAGAQILVQATPVGRFALILRGPLATGDDPALLARTVAALDRLAVERGYASVRVDTFPTQQAARDALSSAGFMTSAAWHGVMQSLLVPLSGGSDELLAGMKPKGRYNVRQAIKAGVNVVAADAAGIKEFLGLHAETAAHQGFPVFSEEYYEELFRVFGDSGKVKIFLARSGETPVAAICNMVVGGRMYYGWGGISRDPASRKLMANYLLHFSAMEWAREHGCDYYDLVGITEFKEKLGRQQIEWPVPLRKFYGRYGRWRHSLLERSWNNPRLRRGVEFLKQHMGLEQRMPY